MCEICLLPVRNSPNASAVDWLSLDADAETGTQKSWTLRAATRGGKVGREICVRLEGVNGRDEAEAIRGRDVLVARADLPATGSDEYYDFDLIGLIF